MIHIQPKRGVFCGNLECIDRNGRKTRKPMRSWEQVNLLLLLCSAHSTASRSSNRLVASYSPTAEMNISSSEDVKVRLATIMLVN